MQEQRNHRKKHRDLNTLALSSAIDYELVDSGNKRKLERFGKYLIDRPEVEANWNKRKGREVWGRADWHFYEEKGKKGIWTKNSDAPEEWRINYTYKGVSLDFALKLTAFKHIGIFPEQAENWKFIQRELSSFRGSVNVLNLFAYTSAASIVSASCGATVTNVDSVKQAVNWGRQNAQLNEVDNIRWIVEDARKFVKKSIRRGDKFYGIIMDPPAFGHGTKNEKWKLENDLPDLLSDTLKLLHPKKSFFILNTYSPKLSLSKLRGMLKEIKPFPEKYEATTLGIQSSGKQFLPLGNLIRFSK